MKPWTDHDLINASDAIEHLTERYADLSMDAKIDVGARLKAIAKGCEGLDELIKEDIKKARKGRPGTVLGTAFKAVLSMFPVERLDQEKLKASYPDAYADCLKSTPQKRITFESR